MILTIIITIQNNESMFLAASQRAINQSIPAVWNFSQSPMLPIYLGGFVRVVLFDLVNSIKLFINQMLLGKTRKIKR